MCSSPRLRLVNFRSYCDADGALRPRPQRRRRRQRHRQDQPARGRLVRAARRLAAHRREEKLVTWGERFARVELELDGGARGRSGSRSATRPARANACAGTASRSASLDELRDRSQVFIFVPESLLLVKGSPARRRAHLDAFAAALDPRYAAAARDLQAVLRQRNAQLQAVTQRRRRGDARPVGRAVRARGRRAGPPPPRPRRRARRARSPRPPSALAPAGNRFALQLVAQLAALDYDEAALRDELRRAPRRRGAARPVALRPAARRPALPRGRRRPSGRDAASDARAGGAASSPRPVRAAGERCGPVELPRGGRDLRLFGSQGEQRAAVLALLLAEQQLAAARTGEQGTLFLDDVMSELDDARRRLLVRDAVVRRAGHHHDDQPALLHGARSSPPPRSSSCRSTARWRGSARPTTRRAPGRSEGRR